jgi:hypothetical protein
MYLASPGGRGMVIKTELKAVPAARVSILSVNSNIWSSNVDKCWVVPDVSQVLSGEQRTPQPVERNKKIDTFLV